jgi:8-oxo-dGTP pyrophosphatase MutT (NUDIX family)
MPLSGYLKALRDKVGHDLLTLPSVAIAILDSDGRVLCGLHADKAVWVLPGGLIEPAEHPADAAVRETFEETGLIVEPSGILGTFGGPDLVIHYGNGDVASYVGTIFRGHVIGGKLKADGVETLDVRFISRNELIGLPHSRWMDAAMDAIFATSGEVQFVKATWKPSA